MRALLVLLDPNRAKALEVPTAAPGIGAEEALPTCLPPRAQAPAASAGPCLRPSASRMQDCKSFFFSTNKTARVRPCGRHYSENKIKYFGKNILEYVLKQIKMFH